MADSKDGKPPAATPGKIAHDARGNAVWQWASSTTRQALDSTSRMLKRLDVPGLTLLDDEPKPEEKAELSALEALKAQREAGFNPYEVTRSPGERPADGRPRSPAQSRPAPPRPAQGAAPSAAPPRPVPQATPPAAARSAARPAPTPAPKPVPKPSLLARLFGKHR